jgi:hypothetical protein
MMKDLLGKLKLGETPDLEDVGLAGRLVEAVIEEAGVVFAST